MQGPGARGQTGAVPEDQMDAQAESRAEVTHDYVSTGHLPSADLVKAMVSEAYERFRTNADGKKSDVYPALARVPNDLFGICVVATSGNVYSAGAAAHEFTIMSVSKPF